MSFLEIAPVISVPEFIFSSLTYSLVRASFSQTSAGKQKILHLDTEGFTPFLFWPGPTFFLILALKSYKTENKWPFKILAQTVWGERIENLGQGSLTRINQNLSIIITKVTLLILVSETLTLDCGTLIFENADKNGTRGISVKFRSRILIKIRFNLEKCKISFFLDTAMLA